MSVARPDSVGHVTSGEIPVAAPVRVRERLAAAPDGPRRVLHATASAIYVDLDGWALGLVSATATRVPCALWSTMPDLTVLAPDVRVEAGGLVVGDRRVRIARLVDVRAPRPRRHGNRRFEPTNLMTSGIDLPAGGPLTAAHLDRLLGRGPGLTPLGDDVLAGWLTACAALGRPDEQLADAVRRRPGATTLLSATLLDCAARGEALPQLADWLADPTDSTADALLAVGATSGAGLMTGAGLALDLHTTTHRPGRAA